jgi:hypothetical protein
VAIDLDHVIAKCKSQNAKKERCYWMPDSPAAPQLSGYFEPSVFVVIPPERTAVGERDRHEDPAKLAALERIARTTVTLSQAFTDDDRQPVRTHRVRAAHLDAPPIVPGLSFGDIELNRGMRICPRNSTTCRPASSARCDRTSPVE